jgi:cation-transporting ATPase E
VKEQGQQTASLLRGLSESEVQARRAGGQGHTAPPLTSRSYSQIVGENVFTFINVILFALGFGLVLLGRPGDGLVSVGVILSNVVVSVVQEIRAKRTLDRIALLTRPTAAVIRDGRERSVPPEELVVGDLLRVGSGDQIVLDGSVVGEGRMLVDESQLTGESNLIPKQAGDPVFSGSFCVNGGAWYVAEKVGAASLANQLTVGARAFRRVLTPLQRQIHLALRVILLMVVYVELLLFIDAALKQANLVDSVTNATIVAGLVPNGLFLSISIAYALGAVRIIRFGALVQQSNAIESLSNVDVLCLDKTGTLTANRLQVASLHPIGMSEDDLRGILGAVVASAATYNKTSEAIAAAFPGRAHRVVSEVPFSSARKWSAVALDGQGEGDNASMRGVYAFGAPEMLQSYLASSGDPAPLPGQSIEARANAWTAQGLRVLLVAHHPNPSRLKDEGDASRLPEGMTPIGLVSLRDELRPEARETLSAFVRSGVRPKIISGDHPQTVASLARQAGLGPDIRLVSGPELETMDEAQFAQAAASSTIFGRITPHQKERLVEALRQRGHYVAMIGDGVNDVLSLKKANLGVAMQSGSQATRGVADIVLMNDSFAALAPAVQEGQRIVNGMQDILKLYLARIGTFALVILSSMMVGGMFPIALRQGSLVTLLSVGIPTVLLAVWAQPRPLPKAGLLRRLAHFVLPPVALTSLLGLLLFYGSLILEASASVGIEPGLTPDQIDQIYQNALPIAQTALASFMVLCGLLLVVFVEPPTPWWEGGDRLSGDWRPTLLAAVLLIAFGVVSLVPSLRVVFALAALGWAHAGLVAAAVLVWLCLVRWAWRRRLLERFLSLDPVW